MLMHWVIDLTIYQILGVVNFNYYYFPLENLMEEVLRLNHLVKEVNLNFINFNLIHFIIKMYYLKVKMNFKDLIYLNWIFYLLLLQVLYKFLHIHHYKILDYLFMEVKQIIYMHLRTLINFM